MSHSFLSLQSIQHWNSEQHIGAVF
jgi:hypothetical protein